MAEVKDYSGWATFFFVAVIFIGYVAFNMLGLKQFPDDKIRMAAELRADSLANEFSKAKLRADSLELLASQKDSLLSIYQTVYENNIHSRNSNRSGNNTGWKIKLFTCRIPESRRSMPKSLSFS